MSLMFAPSVTYKPFRYPWAVDLTKRHEKVHWLEEEADLSDDVTDWKLGTVNEREKHFIIQVLRLFTQSDVNVGEFYKHELGPRIVNNEVSLMLDSFRVREGTHQRAYALINDTLGLPESEHHAFLDYKAMRDKHEHMLAADTSTDAGLMLALAKGVCNEGISLFASFAMLLNFQRQGKMKGMGKVVEWSQRDETLHVIGLTHVFRALAEEMPHLVTDALKRAIYDMVRETIRLEDAFVSLAFEMGGIEGLTEAEVNRYTRFVANRRLTMLGLKEEWDIPANPLPWVDWLVAGADHTNFFEGKVTEYSVGALTGEFHYGTQPTETAIVLYTKPGCPWCDKAKALLAGHGILPIVRSLADEEERIAFYRKGGFAGFKGRDGATMPKVYELSPGAPRPVLIGGYAELLRALGPAPEPEAPKPDDVLH